MYLDNSNSAYITDDLPDKLLESSEFDDEWVIGLGDLERTNDPVIHIDFLSTIQDALVAMSEYDPQDCMFDQNLAWPSEFIDHYYISDENGTDIRAESYGTEYTVSMSHSSSLFNANYIKREGWFCQECRESIRPPVQQNIVVVLQRTGEWESERVRFHQGCTSEVVDASQNAYDHTNKFLASAL